jgi:hypothetical protein
MDGVTIHDRDKAFEGYTLFSQTYREELSADRQIHLIDMDGRIVQKWQVQTTLQSYMHLLPDGNMIHPTHDRSDVARGPFGLYELDPDSNVVWDLRCRTDHDFQVLDSGNILVHCITENFCPVLGPGMKRQPYMVEVTRDKELVWEWKGEEHLNELETLLGPERWQHVMDRATGQFAFDWAHNNTLQVVPPNATAEKEDAAGGEVCFRPGNIVFSYRSVDVIGVIDKASGTILWAWGPGVIDGQHKPHMLPNGNILIFDNGTLRKYSRVIEVNPLTEEIEWEYTGTPREDFFAAFISGAQRLPNGNTLICEGGKSHLFEVTPEGQIVWDFVDPHHTVIGHSSVYRCTRYSPEYVEPLLRRTKQ